MDEEHKALRRSLTKAEGQLRKLELQMRMLNFRYYMLLALITALSLLHSWRGHG